MDENTGARFPDSPEINVLELPKISGLDGTALSDNTPHEFIAKLTGLSLDEITRLAAELKH